MRRLALVCLVSLVATSGAGARSDAPILTRSDYLHVFAADGARIALPSISGPPRWCHTAEVVDVATGKRNRAGRTQGICDDDWATAGPWEIAVASDRVAWIAHGATNNSSGMVLSTSRIGSRAGRVIVYADGPTVSGDEVGYSDRRVGLLGGDGATLAFATWTIAPGGKLIRNERVWRIGPTGAKLPVGRVAGLTAIAVEHGTIAALDQKGRVSLFDTRSRTRRTVVLQGLGRRTQQRRDFDLAFGRGRLVVLTGTSLEVYDATSGALTARWQLPPVESRIRGLVDFEGDWISFLVRNRIHLRRISDGASAVLPPERLQPRGCEGDVWAQVENVGLIFSSSRTDGRGCGTSRVEVIGFDELATFVGGG